MKDLTDKEIEEGILALVQPLQKEQSYGFYDLTVHVRKNLATSVVVEVTSEYESPCRCDLALLQQVADFFGATNAEKYDDISAGGCETCDYGSSYGFAIRVWD